MLEQKERDREREPNSLSFGRWNRKSCFKGTIVVSRATGKAACGGVTTECPRQFQERNCEIERELEALGPF
jgi:hypothetical protein